MKYCTFALVTIKVRYNGTKKEKMALLAWPASYGA